ncbi:MAG: RNA polymerase sigma factor [Acidimicrobiales bacterium]
MPVQTSSRARTAPPPPLHARAEPLLTELRASVEDRELALIVVAAARGDETSWTHLCHRFGNMINAIARSCRLGEADVGEVFQTTWLRLVENIDRIEQPERVGAWLATTARRESLRLVRSRARFTFDGESFEVLADPDGPSPDAGLLTEERATAMRAAYARLPLRCQRLLGLLSADDSPSYKDISELLDMPIGSIGPTRGRCLEHLRRILLEVAPET